MDTFKSSAGSHMCPQAQPGLAQPSPAQPHRIRVKGQLSGWGWGEVLKTSIWVERAGAMEVVVVSVQAGNPKPEKPVIRPTGPRGKGHKGDMSNCLSGPEALPFYFRCSPSTICPILY